MLWWKEIAALKRRLTETQAELEQEQGKSTRLAGFVARLQTFGISPMGRIPRQEFAEGIIDAIHSLLGADQILLLHLDPETFDFLPAAGRGFSPESLSRLRVRSGEGVLGRAAQSLKMVRVAENSHPGEGEEFLTGPSMIFPLLSQARCLGLLYIGKPKDASFKPDASELAALFAAQAALILEDHTFYADLGQLRTQAMGALVQAIEAKDVCTQRHSARTKSLVRAVAQELALPDSLIQHIEDGAYLHDIGKIGIEDAILKKTGPLTPDEYTTMKTHPALGHEILQPLEFLRAARAIVLYHQEWYNGAGYPEGLAGEEIPLGARIVQIIDAWDAMTSDRPYRKAMTKTAAITELRRQAGTQFDPKLVELFLRVVDRLGREGIPTTEMRQTTTIEN